MAPSPSAAAAAQRLARGCNSHAGGSEHELRPVVCAGKPALTSQCVGDACHAPRLPGCARATAMRGRASQGARSGAGAGGAFGPPTTCERGPRTSAQAERARACEHDSRSVACAGKPALAVMQCVGDACHAPRLPGCARTTALRGRASRGARSGAGAGGALGPPITFERGPRTSAQAERARACVFQHRGLTPRGPGAHYARFGVRGCLSSRSQSSRGRFLPTPLESPFDEPLPLPVSAEPLPPFQPPLPPRR